jgi:hypothetical protein
VSDDKKLRRKTLNIPGPKELGGEAEALKHLTGPHLGSAMVALDFAAFTMDDLPLNGAINALKDNGEAIAKGDLSAVEAMLASQAVALNAIFSEMARRAAQNLGENPRVAEDRLRMAFKAQNQCRMTLETLATVKAGPAVFAKQANITSGPQQVNNGVPAIAHVRKNLTAPNELLEIGHELVERMDAGAAGEAVGGDPAMASVGEIDRTKNGGGEGQVEHERRQGQRAAASSGALADAAKRDG